MQSLQQALHLGPRFRLVRLPQVLVIRLGSLAAKGHESEIEPIQQVRVAEQEERRLGALDRLQRGRGVRVERVDVIQIIDVDAAGHVVMLLQQLVLCQMRDHERVVRGESQVGDDEFSGLFALEPRGDPVGEAVFHPRDTVAGRKAVAEKDDAFFAAGHVSCQFLPIAEAVLIFFRVDVQCQPPLGDVGDIKGVAEVGEAGERQFPRRERRQQHGQRQARVDRPHPPRRWCERRRTRSSAATNTASATIQIAMPIR